MALHHEKPHQMERFLEVCLLMILCDEIGYGYGLTNHLVFFGFSKTDQNIGTLYRTLRKMEKEGFVTSLWEKGGPGPKKRVYKITTKGKKELDQRIEILKTRKTFIEKLLIRYDNHQNMGERK